MKQNNTNPAFRSSIRRPKSSGFGGKNSKNAVNDSAFNTKNKKRSNPKVDMKYRSDTGQGKRAGGNSGNGKARRNFSLKNDNAGSNGYGKALTKVLKPVKNSDTLKILPIGGLNEIGKNMTAFEYDDQIIIIDCGMSFPEDDMFGIDVVIPDFSYLTENAKKVKGVVITHGHEDHIGGIPYLLKKLNVPIYGTQLPLGLIKNKLEEHKIKADLRTIAAGDKFKIGKFKIEALRTTHSIADAICFYVETPVASFFHTGDFKVDFTPIDEEPIDFARLAEIGKNGVDLLMADSTNVLKPGFTPSEQLVGETLEAIFREATNRIIIATFSSNVHRVQKIIELSVKYGRKFTVSGRSMENVVKLAEELGYLKFPAGSFVELNKMKNVPDKELVVITTGSQGEPMSALARMADDEHRNVKLKRGDMVILSSTPVPGNEKTVSNVVNKLYKKEVNVIYNDIADIHVSGHACQEDLKLMHSLIRPKYFMPVHGEHRHLVRHSQLAESLGTESSNIFILENGDQLSIGRQKAVKYPNVINAEDILVDGLGVGDVGDVVLNERRVLSEAGLIVVAATIDIKNRIIISEPELHSRGFVYVKEHGELMKDVKEHACSSLEHHLNNGKNDWNAIRNGVRNDMRKYVFARTKRSPMVLCIFMDA